MKKKLIVHAFFVDVNTPFSSHALVSADAILYSFFGKGFSLYLIVHIFPVGSAEPASTVSDSPPQSHLKSDSFASSVNW